MCRRDRCSPGPIDHAKDMAFCAACRKIREIMAILILDFKDAFMTIPLHDAERRFNCCAVPEGISRSREPVYEAEPEHGDVVVWRVLGFGGRPSPLLFARAASFAMRSAHCLAKAIAKSQ